jgi:hypothetical protein
MTRRRRAALPHSIWTLDHLRSNLHWLSIALVACASAPPRTQAPGSRGLHASGHLTAASEHDEESRESWPDTRTTDATGRADQLLIATPRHRDSDTDRARAAAMHRSEAQAIYDEYERACGSRGASDVSVSPIVRYGMGGGTIPQGVVLYLTTAAGPPDRLVRDLECHRAWMRLAPANMDKCPLDLAGLKIDASGSGEGITLTLTVRDPRLIGELQQRAAHDLELGHHH